MKRTIVAYCPVVHRGYLDFFNSLGEGNTLLIPDESVIKMIDYLGRDMRALSPDESMTAIRSLDIFSKIRVADIGMIIEASYSSPIIMPDEDISHEILKLLPKKTEVILSPVFLRWHRFNVIKENEGVVFWDEEIDIGDFNQLILKLGIDESEKSSDWWRQVGAVSFKNGNILLAAHNRHLPTELEPYYSGDPRTVFKQGEHIEYSGAIHGEAAIVAEAAKRGIVLLGSEMFVTTFPCPPCANLVSQSGIKTLYFLDGYSQLAAKEIFAANNIRIVKIKRPSS